MSRLAYNHIFYDPWHVPTLYILHIFAEKYINNRQWYPWEARRIAKGGVSVGEGETENELENEKKYKKNQNRRAKASTSTG